jgi:zinc transporter ZupT
MLILFSFLTFLSTYIWGLFSLKFKNSLHSIMAFTAWILLWVVCFEIFPELIDLIKSNNFKTLDAMIALVTGFLLFHILEKTILIHHWHEWDYAVHHHPHVWILSAVALIFHSFIDWIWIWLGFQFWQGVWIIVAIAVISHDFTDGMNTVSLMLHNKNSVNKAKIFLLIDSIAPIIWAISTLFFKFSSGFLIVYLSFFAGFLLYIWASDILPEAHSEKSSYKLLGLTLTGVFLIYFLVLISGS